MRSRRPPPRRPAPRPGDERRARPGGRPPRRAPGDDRGPRRALSMAARPGAVSAGGDPQLAEGLVAALRAGRDLGEVERLTHPVHAYPARMHPGTAAILVRMVMSDRRDGLLLDPFCGSGTTLVEARALGLAALGVDLNPIAVLIARAKTWTASESRRRFLVSEGARIAEAVFAEGKRQRRGGYEPPPQRAPAGFDPNARNRRLARWFAPHVRRELELIASGLDELRRRDAELADILLVPLSAILYKVSSRASDTDPTWVRRNVARGAACRYFAERVDRLAAGLDELAATPGPMPEVIEHDARALGDRLKPGGAAGIVTSPPYAGTYDYAEQHRLRFDFFGIRHRTFTEHELGARRAFDGGAETLSTWRRHLTEVIDMIARALPSGGRAALVIGDSMAAGHAHFADEDLRGALSNDVAVVAWASEERSQLGAPERRAFGPRPKREHAVLLVRR